MKQGCLAAKDRVSSLPFRHDFDPRWCQIEENRAATIEDENAKTRSAQKGFERKAQATSPTFTAQAEERLVSIPQCLAHARSTGARARARAKQNEANVASDKRCGLGVHRSDQHRWPNDEHRLSSGKI
jgi:hypothetical protein